MEPQYIVLVLNEYNECVDSKIVKNLADTEEEVNAQKRIIDSDCSIVVAQIVVVHVPVSSPQWIAKQRLDD